MSSTPLTVWLVVMSTRPERERASTSTDAVLQAPSRSPPVSNPRPEDSSRIQRGHTLLPCSSATPGEVRLPWRRTCPRFGSWWTGSGRRLVSLAYVTVAAGAETVWHRLQATDEIYFDPLGRGVISVGDESGEVGARRCGLDTGWCPAENPAPGSVPLTFYCGPAYLLERDRCMGEAAVDRGMAVTPVTVGDHLVARMRAAISVI